jgi:hypothetical protein
MSKPFFLRTAAVLILLALSQIQNSQLVSAANNIEVDGLSYTIQGDNTLRLFGCTSKCGAKNLVIPAEAQSMPVVKISPMAFQAKNLSGSLTIPDSVTDIGMGAFYDNKLTQINLPISSVTIASSAFARNQISSFSVPTWLTDVPDSFMDKNPLKTLVVPEGVTRIGDRAFQEAQLTRLVLPSSLVYVGADSFSFIERKKALNVFMLGPAPTFSQEGLPFSNFRSNTDIARVNLYVPTGSLTWGEKYGYATASYKVNRFHPELLGQPAPKPVVARIANVNIIKPEGPAQRTLFFKISIADSTTLKLKTTPKDFIGDPDTVCKSSIGFALEGFAKDKNFVFCSVLVSPKWSKLSITPVRYGEIGTELVQSRSVLTGKTVPAFSCNWKVKSSSGGPTCKKQ